MKTMMKIAALTLAMMMTLCTVALADTANPITTATGSSGSDVTASYTAEKDAPAVYYVTLTWGDMEFNVTEDPDSYAWDPATNTYAAAETGMKYLWTPVAENGNKVTVTNGSNTDLDVTVSCAIDSTFSDNGIAGALTLTNGQASTITAVNGTALTEGTDTTKATASTAGTASASITTDMLRAVYEDASKDAVFQGELNMSGSPIDEDSMTLIGTDTKVGTITVTIAQAENAQITTTAYTAR